MIQVVGHRGAAGLAPENTLKGFRKAVELGVDMTECDIHLTRDGRVVVIHDDMVDRTTNGFGAVRALDFNVIRAFDAGHGERVPELGEVLEVVRDRVGLLCELKGEGVEDAAVEAVRSRDRGVQVVFTSFHLDRLERVRETDANLRVAALFVNPADDDIRRAAQMACESVCVLYKNLCLRMVDLAHETGLRVRAWNPDTLPEQQAMMALGVDAISTNRPDVLLNYLRAST
jgi:glycerophosphoryl diester phosphodiesterase